MLLKRLRFWYIAALLGIFMVACQAERPIEITAGSTVVPATASEAPLKPYFTPTASSTPQPPDPATATPFPTPTSTPRAHIVKQGEELLEIAFQYGLTLEELLAANPDIDANFLSVDMVLVIPASQLTGKTPAGLPSPTPASAVPDKTNCYPTGEGGLWCFTAVSNPGERHLESVSVLVRLGGPGVQVAEAAALTPLDLIPPGGVLPAVVYFPAPVPDPYQVNAILQTAFQASALTGRYLPVELENVNIVIAPDGMSARLEGEIILLQQSNADAQLVHVSAAAVAYNAAGDIVGVRRWEGREDRDAPHSRGFTIHIYSLGAPITRVEVAAEASILQAGEVDPDPAP